VTVRPFREGDRLYRMGVHRHESRAPNKFEAATELIVPAAQRAPHRVVRRPPPLPKPRMVVVRHEEPRSHALMLFLGAAIILVAALVAIF
jgi:hypothetical protein